MEINAYFTPVNQAEVIMAPEPYNACYIYIDGLAVDHVKCGVWTEIEGQKIYKLHNDTDILKKAREKIESLGYEVVVDSPTQGSTLLTPQEEIISQGHFKVKEKEQK